MKYKYLVSIILVVKNAENYIKNSLISIIQQDIASKDYEVIVVDGCSTDNTLEIAKQYLSNNNINYKIISNKNKTLAPGWNIGIENAEGEYLVRPDAHAELRPSYILKGITKLNANKKLAGVGGILITKAATKIGKYISIVLSNPFGVGNSSFRIGVSEDTYTDTAVYAVYRKNIFKEIGMFDETLSRNQDIEYHERAKKAGYRFMTSPEMVAYYYNRSTLLSFIRQGYSNGYWVIYSGCNHLRHRVPMYFLLSLILALLEINLFFFIIVLYITFSFLSYIIKSKVYNPIKLLYLSIISMLLHICYGTGSIWGLLKKYITTFVKKIKHKELYINDITIKRN